LYDRQDTWQQDSGDEGTESYSQGHIRRIAEEVVLVVARVTGQKSTASFIFFFSVYNS